MYLICFDISDDKRLRRVSKAMEGVGNRVQKSLFECHLDSVELDELQGKVAELIDEGEDHVRYYPLCNKDYSLIKVDGSVGVTSDPDYHLL